MRILKEIRSLLGNYHIKSGIYHYYRGEYKQAADFLSRALVDHEPRPGSDAAIALHYLTQTHLSAAEESEAASNHARAAEQYARAAALRPGFPDILYRLGRARQRAGSLEEAVTAFAAATRSHPSYLEARKALAFTLLSLGRISEASGEFEKIFALAVERIEVPYREGMRRLSPSSMREAQELLTDAFDRDLPRFDERFRLGLSLLKQEAWDAAAEELRGAIALNPRFADVYNFLGVALVEGGDVEGGIEMFRQAIAFNSEMVLAHLNLAFALTRVGEVKEAERHLGIVLASEPENTPATFKLDEIRSGKIDPKRGVRR